MKTEKAHKEAILRAHQTTEEANQAQEELLHFNEKSRQSADSTQLHESPANLMQSWHNLRNLDQDLAENKYSDLADDINKADKKGNRK